MYLCHDQPDLLIVEAEVLATRPGAIALSRSAFHPGGGGQVGDRGWVHWSGGHLPIAGIEVDGDRWWHLIASSPDTSDGSDGSDDATTPAGSLPDGAVTVEVDGEHRSRVASLHTTSHILNALVFAQFAGALVTGAQINGDGTGRMDFDLPEVDNDRLRALADPINRIIDEAREVRAITVDLAEVDATPGLIRSLSVAPPPTPDGRLRIIEIDGLDRQACGGTHLNSTDASPHVVITKIENKGRRNRRIRFAFA